MTLPDPPQPFVLLDDARDEGARPARLYTRPIETVQADRIEDVLPALDRLRAATASGLHVAGYLSYEAGFAFEERLNSLPTNAPLLWFGLFEGYEEIAPAQMAQLLGQGDARAGPLRPHVSIAEYSAAFEQVQAMIRAGDIYQANLTFSCSVPISGDPRALYAALRAGSKAGYGALVMTGERWLLSFSPELFFTLDQGSLTTRPMKGTAVRATDPTRDGANAARLLADPKQRAENLMIVDLLRNDLSRVAQPGSVAVPHLFAIESYPTVHQMTSTVTARLRSGLDAVDVLRALFPCGSITGAPKLRAMEVIREVESGPRGAYTGSIGYIDAGGAAAQFNVAIRTICAEYGADEGILGLGSGVVADSVGAAEWAECLDKARFLNVGDAGVSGLE